MVGKLIAVILAAFVMPPVLTCVTETPIVKKLLKIDSILYICAVNILTNVILNVSGFFIYRIEESLLNPFVAVSELIFIPVSEAILFMLVSDDKKRCFWVSYLANAVSFSVGLLVNYIIKKTGLI